MCKSFLFCSLLATLVFAAGVAVSEPAAFDLTGPRIELKVTRGGKTLGISETPNLQPGDRLWVRPDFPTSEAAHYLLVVVFLRGSTNPPPESWFTKAESWDGAVREKGITVTVPDEAQQALLLLAPQSGGDFTTLRNAVRGRPGSFVRASQDLNQASLDRARLDKYLDAMRELSDSDPAALHARSLLLARSLNIKLDTQCFDKATREQGPCLLRDTDQLVMDDEHTDSMVATLTSGPSADVLADVSVAPFAGAGTFSPYVGAAIDVTHLLESLHTAQYLYIPGLASTADDHISLKLSSAPSFHKPKSVLVVSLPPIEAPKFPPLRPVERDHAYCLQSPALTLPVEGAPLVFATSLAHDLQLHLHGQSGPDADVAVHADALRGGLVMDSPLPKDSAWNGEVVGELRGSWGFDRYEGPIFSLRNAHSADWVVPGVEPKTLTAGEEKENHVRVQSDEAGCVESVTVRDQKGNTAKATWQLTKGNELEVSLSLKGIVPGPFVLLLKQHGLDQPDEVHLRAYSEAPHLEQLALRAGEFRGLLRGTHLDEVAELDVDGIHFHPDSLHHNGQKDELDIVTTDSAVATALHEDQKPAAHVALKDGRVLELPASVLPARPKVELVGKTVAPGKLNGDAGVHLADHGDLPQDGRLTFRLKSVVPPLFPRTEKIEIATADQSFHALLSLADESLVLQDQQSVLAVVDPLKQLGPSAFGPLRFRPINEQGDAGDWQPLVNLVRVPAVQAVHCPGNADDPCTLKGQNLFLIDSVAANSQFSGAVSVPKGFANDSLEVPHPNGGELYLKLRDDPAAPIPEAVPVLPQ